MAAGQFWFCNLCQLGDGTRSCIFITSQHSDRGPEDHPCLLNPNWSAEWLPIKVYNCPKCDTMMLPHGAPDGRDVLKMTCPRCGYSEFKKVGP